MNLARSGLHTLSSPRGGAVPLRRRRGPPAPRLPTPHRNLSCSAARVVRRCAPPRGRDPAAPSRRRPRWACAARAATQCRSTVLPSARNPRTASAVSLRTKARCALASGSSESISRDSTTSMAPPKQLCRRPTRHIETTASAPWSVVAEVPRSTPGSCGCGTTAPAGSPYSTWSATGQPSRSGRPPRTVSAANDTRSRASRPGQPCTARRQRHGTALAPQRRAEQSAGDGGDGVGVVADADGGVQGVLQVQAARLVGVVDDRRRSDCRRGSLQRGDRVAVGAEAGRVDVGVGALVYPGGPLGAAARRAAGRARPGARPPRRARPRGSPRTTARRSRRPAGRRGSARRPRGRPEPGGRGRRGGRGRPGPCASVRRCRPSARAGRE